MKDIKTVLHGGRYLLFSLFLMSSLSLFSQSEFQITHGPYLTNMTQDGVSIIWTTTSPALSWVEVAPDDGTDFHAAERFRYYDVKDGRRIANSTFHHVHLKDLTPGTTYRYRVCSHEVTGLWQEQHQVIFGKIVASDWSGKKLKFTTFANRSKDISFIVLNDTHGNPDLIRNLCKNIDFKTLDMIVLNGDMTSFVNSEEQIFHDYIDPLVEQGAGETPIVFARGNHENRGSYADRLLAYFPTPTGYYYYNFSIGDTDFLILDCGEDKPDTSLEYNNLADYNAYREEQAEWVSQVTQSEIFKSSKNKMCILHMGLVGDDMWCGNLHLRSTLLSSLNASRLDVMLSGHTHRLAFHPAEDIIAFPTVVNANDTYALCRISSGKIKVDIVGLNGLLKTYNIK